MINESTDRVLIALRDSGVGKTSTVVTRQELTKRLDGDFTRKELDECVEKLRTLEYVASTYTDENVYCLCFLPRGMARCDRIDEEERERRRQEQRAREVAEKQRELSKKGRQSEVVEIIGQTDESGQTVVPTVIEAPKMPVAKIVLTCALSSFFGCIVAGVICFFLAKIL